MMSHLCHKYVFYFTLFTHLALAFAFLHFPKCISLTPGEQLWVCCIQLSVWCVGGSSESIVRSSKRLVKRKSCSPDSQTSTCLFSAPVGVSAHRSWFLPLRDFENTGGKSCFSRTKPEHFLRSNDAAHQNKLFKSVREMTLNSFKVTKDSSVCLWSLHPRINASHPEINPTVEPLDETAAVLKWRISPRIFWLDKNMKKK